MPPPPSQEADETAGGDRISSLPDRLLSAILSHLSGDDSARTTVLSTRWKHLWSISPLNLDAHSINIPDWCATFDHILSTHTGPIRICRISRDLPSSQAPLLNSWIETLTQRNIHSLVLKPCLSPNALHRLLDCESLRNLWLARSEIDIDFDYSIVRNSLPFPSALRELNIYCTFLTDEAVFVLLLCCPVLESLELLDCVGIYCVRINSPSLCSFRLRESPHNCGVHQLFIENAPNLARLLFDEMTTTIVEVTVLFAPKLQYLGFVDMDMKRVELWGTCFKRTDIGDSWSSSLSTVPPALGTGLSSLVPTIRTLAIRVCLDYASEKNMVADMLRFLPCLEKLTVLIVNMPLHSTPNFTYWGRQGSFDCLDLHLKSVKVNGFIGRDCHVEFISFLATSARVLKSMTVICSHDTSLPEEWLEVHRRRLSLAHMASLDARVTFIKGGE